MNIKRIAIASSIALAAMTLPAMANDDSHDRREVNLCSGSGTGVYYEAADAIRQAAGKNLPVINVETVGTGENITRTVNVQKDDHDSCDAFIGQPDAVVYEAKSAPVIAKMIRPVGTLHREYLHALCGKDSGVEDIGDLESTPSAYSVAIGDSGSGAWYVWQNMIKEDEDYAEVPTVNEGGSLAISSVASGTTSCMLIPAGLGNGTMNLADETYSDGLNLVGVNDRDFDDAQDIKGKPMYEYRDIDGVYKNLQCGSWSCDSVDTLTWLATVYINTEKFENKKELDLFIRAVGQAGVNIKAKYGK